MSAEAPLVPRPPPPPQPAASSVSRDDVVASTSASAALAATDSSAAPASSSSPATAPLSCGNVSATLRRARADAEADTDIEALLAQVPAGMQRLARELTAAGDEDESSDEDSDEGGGGNANGGPAMTLLLAEKIYRDVISQCDITEAPGSPSAARTAASCLLLEQLCAEYPQYESVLGVVADIIMRSIFIPNTDEMRTILGTVKRRIKLPHDLAVRYGRVLKPYARKTYFEAHTELSDGLLQHARSNRNIEARLTRQTNIFERTIKHWSASVLRNHFFAWRQHTRRRRQIRDKYRTIFGRMQVDECKIRAIRSWRDRAAKVKRLAVFDAASIAELESIHGTTERMQEQITALQDYNANLSAQIAALEADRQQLQQNIDGKERQVVELQLRARDMARVGTELLDSAIARVPPPDCPTPVDALVEWAGGMIEMAGGALDGREEPLQPLLAAEAVHLPQIPLAVLGLVMLSFNDEHKPSKEQVVALHSIKDDRKVARELLHMAGRLIGATPLVNEEQLAGKQRSMLLLFLAGLLRHYSNYIVNKPTHRPIDLSSELYNNMPLRNAVGAFSAAASSSSVPPGGDGAAAGLLEASDPEAAATAVVNEWTRRVGFQQQWVALSMSALHATLELALQRTVHLSSEEQEDLGRFLDIPMSNISALLPKGASDGFYVSLLKSLTRVYPDLRKIYAAYALPTMAYHDFVRLLKDCRLLAPQRFSRRQIQLLLREVLGLVRGGGDGASGGAGVGGGDINNDSLDLNTDSTAAAAGRDGGDEGGQSPSNASVLSAELGGGQSGASFARRSVGANSRMSSVVAFADTMGGGGAGGGGFAVEDFGHMELPPAAFTECIIRLAVAHARRTQLNPRLALSSSTIVSNFVYENMVPYALKSDMDRFKKAFRHPLVQQVIARNKISLRRAFHLYATEDDGEGMPLHQFLRMARDCRWIDQRAINEDALANVFRSCQQDNGGSFQTLDLFEWLEALCAVAIYDHPNPLVPLHAKLGPFIEERLLTILMV